MLNTFLQIGKKLREDTSTVKFLPFIEFGDKKAIVDRKGNIKQEKPFVQVYNVYINKNNWEIKKSDKPYDENTNVTFIKGDNQDRFYIAGDINTLYLGNKRQLKPYLEIKNSKKVSSRIHNLSNFIQNFRQTLSYNLDAIQKSIDKFYIKNKKQKLYIQFKFHKNGRNFYWEDLYEDLQDIGNYIIENVYLKKGNLIKKAPISFFSEYNLNNSQFLDQSNSYKSLSIKESIDSLKNIIVASKYISGKEDRFGKAVIQVLPTGKYSKDSLICFLGIKATKRRGSNFKEDNRKKEIDPIDLLLSSFEKDNNIRKYDILFLNKGGQTTDIIAYISSINKTDIERVKSKWRKARKSLDKYYLSEIESFMQSVKINSINKSLIKNITPFRALYNLLRGQGKKNKKLEKHQRIVLYKLFRDQYYRDSQLLRGLIDKTQYGIRNNEEYRAQFLNLFINYLYLNYILHYNQFIMIQNTQSYKAGILLGELARNLDQEINSFSKQYAGNISRRVATKQDFQNLLNFIHEKLVMHEKLYTNVREKSTKLNKLLANFTEQYKKDYAVAGFFYSYMMPFQKKDTNEL